jgi:alkanesulfonate monooxygenase SsuD/methylene tetrahydromethanopterin reductase-like flavin-dependent oxidoreductase (luciferase family)
MRAAIGFCDGWLPAVVPNFGVQVAKFRRMAETAGRDPSTLRITAIFAAVMNEWALPDRATIDEVAQAGVERLICGMPPASRDVVLPRLDAYARLCRM